MFEFLEVENNEYKGQVFYQEFIKDIPDNQRLALSDLQIISPSAATLKSVSKKILDKYLCIPLFTILPGSKPLLPKHLKREYNGYIEGKKNVILYVAMVDPFNLQILNILRSITGYSIVSIPLEPEAAKRFLSLEYDLRSGKKITNADNFSKPQNKEFYLTDLIKFFRHNYFYILFFLVVIAGLISVKLYIKA